MTMAPAGVLGVFGKQPGDDPGQFPGVLIVPRWEWDSTQETLSGEPFQYAFVWWDADPATTRRASLLCGLKFANGVEICLWCGYPFSAPATRIAADCYRLDFPLWCDGYMTDEWVGEQVIRFPVADDDRLLAILRDAALLPADPDDTTTAAFVTAHAGTWERWCPPDRTRKLS